MLLPVFLVVAVLIKRVKDEIACNYGFHLLYESSQIVIARIQKGMKIVNNSAFD